MRSSCIGSAIRATRREGFRIVQYSVQADHVHLVIEAESASVLSSGMRSFAVRVNRRVPCRRGRVWGDRYHRRDLTSPREVRHAFVYVRGNHVKHREPNVGLLDPLSSGPWFTTSAVDVAMQRSSSSASRTPCVRNAMKGTTSDEALEEEDEPSG